MSHHGETISDIILPHSRFYHGPYGRMFHDLLPWEPMEGLKTIIEIGQKMHKGEEDKDNPNIPAGYTYFGQFVNHDITFDATSSLQRQNDPNKLNNFRTPRFDLDSLYGGGPKVTPFMYDYDEKEGSPGDTGCYRLEKVGQDGTACYLLEGKGKVGLDLPRNAQGRAIIGDPRNDENIITSQIHLLFIKFHNKVVTDLVKRNKMPLSERLFVEAQRIVRWHYQWVVVHDFLKQLVGQITYERIRPNPETPWQPNLCFYDWKKQPFIPVEFSVAAFRLHTMVRSGYALNDKLEKSRLSSPSTDLPIFFPKSVKLSVPCKDASDLRGFRRLPTNWTIQWNRFLKIPDKDGSTSGKLQMSRGLNTNLSNHLKYLPFVPVKDLKGDNSMLAVRTLLRGYQMGLPSGQAVARRMGYCLPPTLNSKWDDPLWYYVMKEAELPETQCGGGEKHLGPVGGTIVAEVLFGLLAGDPLSYLNVDPLWTPKNERILNIISSDKEDPDDFQLGDIVKYAGMPINASDIYSLLGSDR